MQMEFIERRSIPGCDFRGMALASPGEAAGDMGSPSPPAAAACRLSREIASAFLDIPVADIERPSRAVVPVCDARHVAIYLAHVVFQISLSRTAREFGRDRTTVAHAVRRIEDRRDDRDFDAMLDRLERLAHAVRTVLAAESPSGAPANGGEIG
ncbi:helix-turn-helix domain-containing protein [Jiella sp. M17.18]|uniref:helix-turn-helix domain-containing protein n=1 Tax=Jiella sp. M17.18 TaxID=3234247 RepID=UPI0034DF5310